MKTILQYPYSDNKFYMIAYGVTNHKWIRRRSINKQYTLYYLVVEI